MNIAVCLSPADGFDRPVTDAVLRRQRCGRSRAATYVANLLGGERPRFATAASSCPTAIEGVRTLRPGVQMVRVDAVANITEMADQRALRDWTLPVFVGQAMRRQVGRTDVYLSVPTSRGTHPEPTGVGLDDLADEPCERGAIHTPEVTS